MSIGPSRRTGRLSALSVARLLAAARANPELTLAELGERFGASRTTVRDILRREGVALARMPMTPTVAHRRAARSRGAPWP